MTEIPNIPTVQQTPHQVQKSLIHLQKCLSALEKIVGIVGYNSPAGRIAQHAIENRNYTFGDA